MTHPTCERCGTETVLIADDDRACPRCEEDETRFRRIGDVLVAIVETLGPDSDSAYDLLETMDHNPTGDRMIEKTLKGIRGGDMNIGDVFVDPPRDMEEIILLD